MSINVAKFNEFNGWMTTVILLMVICGIGVNGKKIDAKMDVMAVLTGPDQDGVKEAQAKLPSYFEMGETKVQMALFSEAENSTAPGSGIKLVLDFTADEKAYQDVVKNWSVPARITGQLAFGRQALMNISKHMFASRGGGRAKALVTVIDVSAIDPKLTVLVNDLLNSGVWLYVIVKDYDPAAVNESNSYTPVKKRLFVIPGWTSKFVDALDNVTSVILDDLCQRDKGCRFTDKTRQKCEFEAWNPFVDDTSQCNTTKPTGTCQDTTKCEQECDTRWPWDGPTDCTGKCGVIAKRSNSTPPPKMEFCAAGFLCPSCPETTTISMPVSTETGPTPTGPMQTGPTQMGPTQMGPTPIGPTQTGPIQTGPTETSPMGTDEASQIETTEGENEAIDDQSQQPGSEEGSNLTWLWIVLGILGIIAVIAVIVGLVIMKKRKSTKPAAAKPATTAAKPTPAGVVRRHVTTSPTPRGGVEESVAADLSIGKQSPSEKHGGKSPKK